MQEMDDNTLLREYVQRGSEEAFAALASRHVNRVYSVALRHTGKPHQAEEITQAVFIILARKSHQLSPRVILEGWLYQAARLTALTFIRSEIRRARREEEAHMQSTPTDTESQLWEQIAPLLDTAMAGLNETDRHAVVLRFLYGKSMREVGEAIGGSEGAARIRLHRALEKLRHFFIKHGVTSTTALIAAALTANSVQAAPAMLSQTATAVALAGHGAAVSASTLTLVKGALKIMAWTKTKTLIATGVAVLFIGGSAVLVPRLMHMHLQAQMEATQQRVIIRQHVNQTHDATLIDLSHFINTALTNSPSSPKGITANNLSQMPVGKHNFAGVPFQVEGSIQLMGNTFKKYGKVYPQTVENIPIGRLCTQLHLLHGESNIPWEQSGMAVAKLILHYPTGGDEELNLIAGQQAFDFWGPIRPYGLRGKPEIKPAPGTELAWVGTNPWVQKWLPQFSLRLYRTTFTNPRPSEVVTSFDYVSTMAQDTAPFLIAMTVE